MLIAKQIGLIAALAIGVTPVAVSADNGTTYLRCPFKTSPVTITLNEGEGRADVFVEWNDHNFTYRATFIPTHVLFSGRDANYKLNRESGEAVREIRYLGTETVTCTVIEPPKRAF